MKKYMSIKEILAYSLGLFGFQAKKISIMVYLIRSKNPCPDGIITVQAKLLNATMTLIFWLSVIVRVKCHSKSLVSSCLLGKKDPPLPLE